MFVQTLNTPNPNSLKIFARRKSFLIWTSRIYRKNKPKNELIRNIMSINGVNGIFLSDDFLSVNKNTEKDWEDIKHIIISFINEYYSDGKKFVYENSLKRKKKI